MAGVGHGQPQLVLNGELATNFTVTPVNGAWEITPLVTITAGDKRRLRWGFAFAVALWVTGAYTGALTCTNAPVTVGPNVGSGAVTPQLVLNGELATNFTVTPVNGAWEITPALVTITAGDYSGGFDGARFAVAACVVSGTYKGALTCTNAPVTVGPNVGSGAVTPQLALNGELATNFTVTPVNGAWEITAAPATITAGDYTVSLMGLRIRRRLVW